MMPSHNTDDMPPPSTQKKGVEVLKMKIVDENVVNEE